MIKYFKDLFVRNWGLKLFSFLMAFLLWLILIPEEKTYSEKTLTVALETRNLPPHMELVEKPPATIEVTFRAPNRMVNEISPSEILARLDMGKASVYQEIYPLNSSLIVLPQGAELVNISPNMVRLKLEKAKQMDLVISPMIVGQVKEGLKIAHVEVLPPSVPVRGPESRIRSKDKVTTTPIDVSRLKQSTTVEADLILPNPDLRLATSLTKVKILIEIEEDLPPADAKTAKKK